MKRTRGNVVHSPLVFNSKRSPTLSFQKTQKGTEHHQLWPDLCFVRPQPGTSLHCKTIRG